MNVPFGLIQSAYGGTPAQAWTSKEALGDEPKLFPIIAEWNTAVSKFPEASENYRKAIVEWEAKARDAKASGTKPPNRPGPPPGPGHAHSPSGLFNAMINPIVPFAIKGAIWYQGESNASKTQAPLYRRLFETMITDWRKQWGIGDFPFLWVQLANFDGTQNKNDWVLVQEAQTQSLELRATGQAVINDIGADKDIHPKNKQDVGARLALAARHVAYQEQLVYSGPRLRTATIESATGGDRGNKVRVWLSSVGGGLKTRGGGELKGFEVAGPDQVWAPAEARIDGSTVVVSAPAVTDPRGVRYAWASWPDANLINAEGLPAGVFRWEGWK
jgi:sialate O-acetylesterase